MSGLPGFHKGAILAPVARHGAKVPMLLAGPRADETALALNERGFKVRAVGPKPEMAAAIKILRSVATKCIVALLYDMTEAAAHYGVEDQVLESAGEFFATEPFPALARTLLKQSGIHAQRLAGEMDEIAEALRAAGLSERVPELARQVFAEIAQANQAVRS
jgi:3-hydroxyisobutyrate dehydrogenase-like beta-hydroxyacid dehydrogenase